MASEVEVWRRLACTATATTTAAHPRAALLVELAARRLLREDPVLSVDVVPVYLRKSDAEIAWDQRARGA